MTLGALPPAFCEKLVLFKKFYNITELYSFGLGTTTKAHFM